jgi:hypothetical protein
MPGKRGRRQVLPRGQPSGDQVRLTGPGDGPGAVGRCRVLEQRRRLRGREPQVGHADLGSWPRTRNRASGSGGSLRLARAGTAW